jgi:hypothetical protein
MQHQTQYESTLIAAFTNHGDAEVAVRKLAIDGFDTQRFSIVGLGRLDGMIMAVVEGSALFGSVAAFDAALSRIGIPKDRVIEYEQAIRTDKFLVVAHGLSLEMEKTKVVLETSNPALIDLYESAKNQASDDMQSMARMDDARAI